jgi:hypothetical protein
MHGVKLTGGLGIKCEHAEPDYKGAGKASGDTPGKGSGDSATRLTMGMSPCKARLPKAIEVFASGVGH